MNYIMSRAVHRNILNRPINFFDETLFASNGIVIKNASGQTILDIGPNTQLGTTQNISLDNIDASTVGGTLDIAPSKALFVNIGYGTNQINIKGIVTINTTNSSDTTIGNLTGNILQKGNNIELQGNTLINTNVNKATSIGNSSNTVTLTGTTINLNSSSNQLTIGTTANKTIINTIIPSSTRTYSIPDIGVDSDFMFLAGTQTISGTKTFSETISATKAFGIGLSVTSDLSVNGSIINMTNIIGPSGGHIITGGTGASNNLTLRSTTNATKGSVIIDETTTSTSATTGALVVSGGVGISGNVFIDGTVTASGGITTIQSPVLTFPVTTFPSVGDELMTANQMFNGLILVPAISPKNLQVATAAALITKMGTTATDSGFKFIVKNKSTNNSKITITTNIGIILDGAMTLTDGIVREFLVVITSPTTVTIHSLTAAAVE